MPRYLPNLWDIMAAESGRKLRGKVAVGMRAATAAKRRRSDIAIVEIPEVPRDRLPRQQTLGRREHRRHVQRRTHLSPRRGAEAAKGKTTYRKLHADVLARLAKARFDEVLQLEGSKANLDRGFLDPLVVPLRPTHATPGSRR